MTVKDEIDDRILRVLSGDGRISNIELADKVGLSPSACLRRVRDLEESNVIRGYRAVLDPDQTGRGFVAVVMVGLNNHSTDSQLSFERAMEKAEDVIQCLNITGVVEYMLRVECADLAAYKRFHSDVLGRLEQVNAITTHVVMGAPKDLRQ